MSTLRRKISNLTLVITAAFLFCILSTFSMVNTLVQNKEDFIKSFGDQQEVFVRQIKNQCQNMLIAKKGSEQDVIQNILETTETSGNKFWFLVNGDRIVFYKNSFEMKKLNIRTIEKMLRSFKAANGYNISELTALAESKKDTTVLFSSAKNEGRVLASIQFFEANGAKYAIGMCTTESYILSKGNIVKHDTYTIINLVLVCLALFSAIITGSLLINKKNQEILICQKSIHAKNIKIEEIMESSQKSDSMYNQKTKLYGKRVLHALLKKASRPELFPVSTLTIDIKYSDNITYDDSVFELSPLLQKILPKNSVAARANESRLVILFFKTEYEKAKAFEQKLLKEWNSVLSKFEMSVNTDVFTQTTEQESMLEIYKQKLKSNQYSKKEKTTT